MTTIEDLYQRMARKNTLYIRFHKNFAEVKHIESGNSITRKALIPYSNDRLIISEVSIAEEFYREIIEELIGAPRLIFPRGLRILLQPVDPEIIEISELESKAYREFAYNIGASKYLLCHHQRIMSNEEVLSYRE